MSSQHQKESGPPLSEAFLKAELTRPAGFHDLALQQFLRQKQSVDPQDFLLICDAALAHVESAIYCQQTDTGQQIKDAINRAIAPYTYAQFTNAVRSARKRSG